MIHWQCCAKVKSSLCTNSITTCCKLALSNLTMNKEGRGFVNPLPNIMRFLEFYSAPLIRKQAAKAMIAYSSG